MNTVHTHHKLSARALLSAGTVLAALLAAPAAAQETADTAAEEETAIVVTGTRLQNSTFNAPTPTSVVSAEQLQQSAQPNVFEAIAQLPTLSGSVGTANRQNNGGTSFGNNGISSLNLRALGQNRTLVLIDGQRVVASHVTGLTDVSAFPQLLISRVDVVTGGASASWGSDAVAGVVNFVTDTRFEGIKGNIQGGISTYGDDESVLAQLAGGFAALDDRLHVQLSVEYYDNQGVPGGDIGGAQPNGRPDAYRSGTTSYSLTGTPAGSPRFFNWAYDAQNITLGRYALITAGPLRGITFNDAGQAYNFQYGTPCIATTCLGGQQDNFVTTSTIDNPLTRMVGYGRAAFEVSPALELYASLTVAKVETFNSPLAFPRKPGNLTIKCSNAYLANVTLPGSTTTIPQACAANSLTTLTVGTINANFPLREQIYTDRQQIRWVVGANGEFDMGGMPVSYDAYYQSGRTEADLQLKGITLNGHYNAAIDTIVQDGRIVCFSATARSVGCNPVNIFTGAPVTEPQFLWMAPDAGPYQLNTFKQDAAAIALNFAPFSTWAGEVAVALGAEWREESYNTIADPYGNGWTGDTPATAAYPVNPLLNPAGNNWFAGNFRNGEGAFSVKEAFIELGIPLADDSAIGTIDLNLGGRIADYSTAGSATTWKVGATWETPLEGLRLRGVVSRDIRAPNLNELFAPVTAASQNVINRATGGNVQVLATTIGNVDLKPEEADTWQLGAVFQPDFLPGLNLSVDYYDVSLGGAISTLTIQQIVDLCFQGNTAYCAFVDLDGTFGSATNPTSVIQKPFNFATAHARGIDFEASYQIPLGSFGRLTLRGVATHAIDMINDTGIAGQQIAQLAGNNTSEFGAIAKWKGMLIQQLDGDSWRFTVTERFVSSGALDPEAITCTSNCPAPTVQNPTYNFNHIPGAVYVDIGGSYNLTEEVEMYFKVDNLFNHRAPPFGASSLYDVIGRMFRAGVRFEF